MNTSDRMRSILLALVLILAGCGATPPVPAAQSQGAPEPVRATTAPPNPSPTPTTVPTDLPTTTAVPTMMPKPTASPTATPLPPTPTDAPTATPTSAPAAARYVFPVQGARVRYGAAHHDYPAADIFCPIGSTFVAPTDGIVDYVSYEDIWKPSSDDPAVRGGLSIALVGDDGVRYYGSHLSKIEAGIEPGVRVTAGQTLGLTGDSGNARGVEPHLHFGISHPTTPDDWQVRRGEIPPYTYLKAWERGENLAPELDNP